MRAAGLAAAVIAAVLALPGAAAAVTASNSTQFAVNPGSIAFYSAPTMPTFPTVTLNGQSQTDNATMGAFSVIDASGTGLGWNLTVNGNSGTGTSPVFAQYCPNATCGTDTGPGYVGGGASLPAGSLTLNSTGGLLSGLLGTLGIAPTFGSSCPSGCAMDVSSSSPTKVLTAALLAGMGIWQAAGFSSTSLAVAIPTTIKALQTNEIYRLDLLWTLGSGP